MNRTAIALLAVAVGAAVTLHVYFGVSLGLALLIFFVGWPVLGTLITIDDDSKGGWSNPDGTVRPPWLQAPFWGQIIVGFALSSCGAAIDYGWLRVHLDVVRDPALARERTWRESHQMMRYGYGRMVFVNRDVGDLEDLGFHGERSGPRMDTDEQG